MAVSVVYAIAVQPVVLGVVAMLAARILPLFGQVCSNGLRMVVV